MKKVIWNQIAQKHQFTLQVLRRIMVSGCLQCSARPVNWSSYEFHMHSSHGIPRELLMDYLLTKDIEYARTQ